MPKNCERTPGDEALQPRISIVHVDRSAAHHRRQALARPSVGNDVGSGVDGHACVLDEVAIVRQRAQMNNRCLEDGAGVNEVPARRRRIDRRANCDLEIRSQLDIVLQHDGVGKPSRDDVLSHHQMARIAPDLTVAHGMRTVELGAQPVRHVCTFDGGDPFECQPEAAGLLRHVLQSAAGSIEIDQEDMRVVGSLKFHLRRRLIRL
jgi:hypothetical protein